MNAATDKARVVVVAVIKLALLVVDEARLIPLAEAEADLDVVRAWAEDESGMEDELGTLLVDDGLDEDVEEKATAITEDEVGFDETNVGVDTTVTDSTVDNVEVVGGKVNDRRLAQFAGVSELLQQYPTTGAQYWPLTQ